VCIYSAKQSKKSLKYLSFILSFITPTAMANKKKNSKKRRIILIAVLALLVIGGASAAFMFGNRDKSIPVQIEKVSRRTITQIVSSTGKVQPETEVKVSSEASGEIIFLAVKEGDRVKKGQLLVRIQPDLVQAQVEQFRASAEASKAQIGTAQAEVNRTKAVFERIKTLADKQFASKDDLDNATAAYNSALARLEAAKKDYERSQASLKQSEASSSRTTIYAPIDGVVTSLSIEQGEKVVGTAQMQGTEMMRISDLNVMNAEVEVDENDVVLISIGDTTRVKVDAFPGKEFKGYVKEIGNSAKAKAAGQQDAVVNFSIKVRLIDNNDNFRPGMSCDADIETETHSNVLAVPLQAVTLRKANDKQETQGGGSQGGGPGEAGNVQNAKQKKADAKQKMPSVVFVQNGGTVKMQEVETGISDNGYIEIKTGIDENTTVISGPFRVISRELEDGAKVRVDSTMGKKPAVKQ
jgi:HlyD family secretion protein